MSTPCHGVSDAFIVESEVHPPPDVTFDSLVWFKSSPIEVSSLATQDLLCWGSLGGGPDFHNGRACPIFKFTLSRFPDTTVCCVKCTTVVLGTIRADYIALCHLLAPDISPEIEEVMQVHVGDQW